MNKVSVKSISRIGLLIALLSLGAGLYMLGFTDGKEYSSTPEITINYPPETAVDITKIKKGKDEENKEHASSDQTGELVASQNGTRYYTPGCSGIGRIHEENKIYFNTPREAKAAGYTLAQACD